MNAQHNDTKTEQMLLYLVTRLQDCPSFGSVLLNKVFYYSDHINYLKRGKTISGLSYVKQEFGPTPAPKEFMPLRERMISAGSVEMHEVETFGGRIQKRLVPKKDYQLGHFTSEEVSLMDEVIKQCRTFNASEISDNSHNELAWQLAGPLEPLPSFTYLLTKSELNQDDLIWAEDRAAKHKLVRNY